MRIRGIKKTNILGALLILTVYLVSLKYSPMTELELWVYTSILGLLLLLEITQPSIDLEDDKIILKNRIGRKRIVYYHDVDKVELSHKGHLSFINEAGASLGLIHSLTGHELSNLKYFFKQNHSGLFQKINKHDYSIEKLEDLKKNSESLDIYKEVRPLLEDGLIKEILILSEPLVRADISIKLRVIQTNGREIPVKGMCRVSMVYQTAQLLDRYPNLIFATTSNKHEELLFEFEVNELKQQLGVR